MAWHPGNVTVTACLIAQALNIGYDPIVAPGVDALERDRIGHVNQTYMSAETYSLANQLLIDAQSAIPLAQAWGGGPGRSDRGHVLRGPGPDDPPCLSSGRLGNRGDASGRVVRDLPGGQHLCRYDRGALARAPIGRVGGTGKRLARFGVHHPFAPRRAFEQARRRRWHHIECSNTIGRDGATADTDEVTSW